MKEKTVKELYEFCKEQIEVGNGNCKIWLEDDNGAGNFLVNMGFYGRSHEVFLAPRGK